MSQFVRTFANLRSLNRFARCFGKPDRFGRNFSFQYHPDHLVASMTGRSQYILPVETEVCLLECKTAFNALTPQEKLYAHYISQASWYGSLACLFQTSPESAGIFVLLQKLFRHQTVEEITALALEVGITQDELKSLLVYIAGVYSNMGNYKSFGDTKFIPDLSEEKFAALIRASKAYQKEPEAVEGLLKGVQAKMFSLGEREKQLGLGDKGITTYFSGNCDEQDAEAVGQFHTEKGLSAYNTRTFKTLSDSGHVNYEIRQASAETGTGGGEGGVYGAHKFQPEGVSAATVTVTRGDYSPLMQQLVANLEKAKDNAANQNEKTMLAEYIKCFTTGSIPAHKEGSRYWIKNKGPIVETYIGFIESYRDPAGTRGEFEGFVAMVNKEMSAKFATLVEHAEHLLLHLPWPAAFEKDKFLRPDFTSLDVLCYASSGIPAGINIPNYDDIRQDEGFKNVSLGNVLAAGYKDSKVTFLTPKDKELFIKYKLSAFEVQVGLHELLGHGSGKLFIQEADGSFNFAKDKVKHTETGEEITSWYDHKETWDSKFKELSNPYEECRAECVGLYLCLLSEVLQIFGHHGPEADDIIYINWLTMVRAGLLSLEFYTPETESWRQAHMQARYVILRVLLEAGDGLVSITEVTGEDGKPDILIKLDRTKIGPVGKQAIGNFLRKLQVYKSTGDYESGKKMFDYYSAVHDNDPPHFLSLRPIVLARKQPRKMFVQCNTKVLNGSVELTEYESTPAGIIQSFQDRFPDASLDQILTDLWHKEQPYFS